MPTTHTVVGRLQLAHPDLGHDGGSTLHTKVRDAWTKISNNVDSRYQEYSSISNSAVNTFEHNFGVAFNELTILLYDGISTSKVRLLDPGASGYTIAATSGFETTKIDITAPSSGGPHDFSIVVVHSGGSSAGGSGTGEINYIDNPDAEISTDGWVRYADAAGTTPVDGTGGSPSGSVTFTRTTTGGDLLRGEGTFKILKDAANRQGEGVSYDFEIDPSDTQKLLKITFDYYASSANFATGDIAVYVYDVTNATLITPSVTQIVSNLTKNSQFISSFSTTSSTSYRLIFHITSTNATAYNLFFDNMVVGPGVVILAPAIGSLKSYDLDMSTSASYSSTIRAVGTPYKTLDASSNTVWRMAFNIVMNVSSSARTSYTATVVGVTFKATTNLLQSIVAQHNGGGIETYGTVAQNASTMSAAHSSQTTSRYFFSGDVELNAKPTFAEDYAVAYHALVAQPKAIAAKYQTDVAQSITTNTTIDFEDLVLDEGHSVATVTTGGSWLFTAPRAGNYQCNAQITFDCTSVVAGETILMRLRKNGTDIDVSTYEFTATATNILHTLSINSLIPMVAGDNLRVVASESTTGTATLTATGSYNTIEIFEASPAIAVQVPVGFGNASETQRGLVLQKSHYAAQTASGSAGTGSNTDIPNLANLTLSPGTWIIQLAGYADVTPSSMPAYGDCNIFVTNTSNVTLDDVDGQDIFVASNSSQLSGTQIRTQPMLFAKYTTASSITIKARIAVSSSTGFGSSSAAMFKFMATRIEG